MTIGNIIPGRKKISTNLLRIEAEGSVECIARSEEYHTAEDNDVIDECQQVTKMHLLINLK